jgi:hypothetical protein
MTSAVEGQNHLFLRNPDFLAPHHSKWAKKNKPLSRVLYFNSDSVLRKHIEIGKGMPNEFTNNWIAAQHQHGAPEVSPAGWRGVHRSAESARFRQSRPQQYSVHQDIQPQRIDTPRYVNIPNQRKPPVPIPLLSQIGKIPQKSNKPEL